jgi:hypothetical protein
MSLKTNLLIGYLNGTTDGVVVKLKKATIMLHKITV